MEWQPIETCPPYGTRVLFVWRPLDHAKRPYHREIVTGEFAYPESEYQGLAWISGRYYDIETHLTHWMPLPPLPATPKGGA